MRRRRPRTPEQQASQAVLKMLSTPEGRKALLVLLLLGALLWVGLWIYNRRSVPRPVATTQPTSSIRIATWNLRKFSERARPDLVAIASLIKSSKFDIVAIQEVQQQGQAVQRLRRQLNEPWRHVISPPAGDGERFAFLYRGDVMELVEEPGFIQSPDLSVFARTPYAGHFRAGGFDFMLITVHLSWGDVDRRRRETQALAQFAYTLAAGGPEKDIIVLGDFNEQRSRGFLSAFEAQGWKRLNHRPTNLSSTEVYDNLLIDPRYTREYFGQSGLVLFDEELFPNDDKRAADDVSDHRPVWADFATAGPDDD